MRDRFWALLTALAVLVVALAPGTARADDALFTWGDQRLTSITGVAADQANQVYWAANGGASTTTAVYAVRPDGRTAARLVLNLPTTSVQAVGYHGGRVYLADVGDPQRTRAQVTVASVAASVTSTSVTYRSWDLTYPDGAHDAKALLLGPGAEIYLVTSAPTAGVYAAPSQLSTTKANALTRVADAPEGVVDGTYLTSGRVALRTATELLEVDPAASWQVTARTPLPQADGESVTTALGGDGLLVAGTGAGTAAKRAALPSAATPSAATPSATAPAASPSPATGPADPDQTTQDNSGTITALVAAAALALGAGAYTLLRR